MQRPALVKPFNDVQRFQMEGAAALPSPPPPKVSGKQSTVPGFLRTLKPSTQSPLLRTDKFLANTDITTLRSGSDSRQVIHDMTRASPDLSAAVTSYIRTGITSGYTAVARNLDGTINPDATSVLAQIVARMDVLNDYSLGFDDSYTLRSVCEVWAKDLVMLGECCGELVLDKARLPNKIQPVSSAQVRLFPTPDGRKRIPKQFVAGQYIDLDIPTFFMVRLDEDLLDAYPVSPIETAIQAVLFSADFMNDVRRVVKKAIHPRVTATIDEAKLRATLPPDVKADQVKLTAYLEGVISALEGHINGMAPEDALVVFDSIGIQVTDHGNTNLSQEYMVVQGMADAKLAAGTKTLPIVLGKSGGTSNTASTEAVLFVKYVEGTVWSKLNEMLSKMLTLAVRLMGQDVTVTFRFNSIDLRPDNELEAFRAMKQSRMLGLLSLGLVGDEECSIELTGHLPPAGYKPLTGTGFMPNTGGQPAGDGYNGASNKGSTLNQNLASDAPKGVKSQNGGKSAEIVPLAR
jgi:hypothetical protein